MNSLDPKDKRRQRRKNHVAKDLKTPKYGQRVVPHKNKQVIEEEEYYDQEYYDQWQTWRFLDNNE
jgi:hypothetical protein